jgi:hypothetical protein
MNAASRSLTTEMENWSGHRNGETITASLGGPV